MHPNMALLVSSVFPPSAKQKGDFGVELEIEGSGLPTEVSGWTAKPEGSLRGEALEYVTKSAVAEADLPFVCKRLAEALEKSTLRLSSRGSTHIHLNIQGMTFRELFGFLFVFTTIEPVLLRLCGPKRNGNLFCLPSYETGDLKALVGNTLHYLRGFNASGGGRLHADHWFQRGKYACLNTDPVPSFGSVEARCFPITVDPAEIVRYASWLMNAKKYAINYHDQTFGKFFTEALDHPRRITNAVFGDLPLNTACSPNTVDELVQLGAETAHEAYWASYDFFHWTADMDKPKRKKKETVVQFDSEPNWDDE